MVDDMRLSVRERLRLWWDVNWHWVKTRGVCYILGCKLDERGRCRRCGASVDIPWLVPLRKVLLPPGERFVTWLAGVQVGHEKQSHREPVYVLLLDLAKDCREMAKSSTEETQVQSWLNMADNLEGLAKRLQKGG